LRNRLALRFGVEGDLRFISHHDSVRLFERALARAGLPVRYSAGFNPRPRMTIVLPRTVGVASEDELLVVELTEPISPEAFLAGLSGQLPRGIVLHGAEPLADGERRIPVEAVYTLPVAPDEAAELARRAAELLAADRVEINRPIPKARTTRTVDLRPYLLGIAVEGDRLRWTQSIRSTGTARPEEVLTALGLDVGRLHRLKRERVGYQP